MTGKFTHSPEQEVQERLSDSDSVIIFTGNGADIYFLLFIMKWFAQLISRRSRCRRLFKLFWRMNFTMEDEL